ncbi:hypothetical protein SH449x_000593 [Pirellulaceae bacterium SH449]
MAVKKQPDPKSAKVSAGANDWFRQFLKHLELSWSEIGQALPSDATPADFGPTVMRAVLMTLLDSRLNVEQVGTGRGYRAFSPEERFPYVKPIIIPDTAIECRKVWREIADLIRQSKQPLHLKVIY